MTTVPAWHTAEHSSSRFAPHGSIETSPEGSLVIYRVAGPFNVEAIKAFGKMVAAVLTEWTPVGPFASLSYWENSMMASPDALALYAHILKAGRAIYPQEAVNVWYVPKDIEGLLIMRRRWEEIYEAGGYPLEIYHSKQDAEERARDVLRNSKTFQPGPQP